MEAEVKVMQPLGLEEAGRVLPQRLWRRHGPASTLSLDLWTSELLENKFLLFQATNFAVICYGCPEN